MTRLALVNNLDHDIVAAFDSRRELALLGGVMHGDVEKVIPRGVIICLGVPENQTVINSFGLLA